jgi:hypothetical protein
MPTVTNPVDKSYLTLYKCIVAMSININLACFERLCVSEKNCRTSRHWRHSDTSDIGNHRQKLHSLH